MSVNIQENQDLRMVFDSGWGVSVQRSHYHKSTDTSYEVAVIHMVNAETEARVCPRQWIAPDGVDGYMSSDMVAMFIDQVHHLKKVEYCTHTRRNED